MDYKLHTISKARNRLQARLVTYTDLFKNRLHEMEWSDLQRIEEIAQKYMDSQKIEKNVQKNMKK